MKKKLLPYAENIAEAGAACLVTMVQGNLLLLAAKHWIVAAQTGLIAGTAAATAIVLAKTENRWILAAILGVSTAVVDYIVQPGGMGDSRIAQAIVTGLGAAALSWIVGAILAWRSARRVKAKSAASEENSVSLSDASVDES